MQKAGFCFLRTQPAFNSAGLACKAYKRNLKAMVATGDALCVGNVEGKDRFDGCTAPHLHLICRCCGEVLDLDMSDALLEHCQQLSETWNVAIDLNSLHFTGLCQTCKDRNELAG